MCEIAGLRRYDRRRFLSYAAGSATSAALAACSRGTPSTIGPPSVSSPDVEGSRATGIPAMATSVPVPISGISQGATILSSQRKFVSPLDPAWSYSAGPWARSPHPDLPTDRMVAVMSGAWIRAGQVLKDGVGRRCAIVTDSLSATLLAVGDGRTLSVSLNGGHAIRIGPLPRDGSRVEVSLFDNNSGPTHIELIFDDVGANDGLYISAGAGVSPVSNADKSTRRLIVLGNGYAEGVGASAPGVTSVAALIGERLKVESINQGWDGTDVDVRRGQQGNPVRNSGLDRVATDAVALAPDAILLIYGLDAALGSTAPTWQYAYDYATLLRTVRTALPGVPIFCSGIPSCNTGISEPFLRPWNDAIRDATITVDNCPYIDAAGWWGMANYYGGSGPVYVASDRLYPNDDGHGFLADKYAIAMAQQMQ